MRTLLLALSLSLPAFAVPAKSTIFRKDSNQSEIMFYWTQTEATKGNTLVKTGTFKTPDGRIMAVETTEVVDGKLKKHTVDHQQTGQNGFLEVRGNKVHFEWTKDGKTKTDDEDLVDNLVVGATLIDYLKPRKEKLFAGETINVRYAVLDRTETFSFNFSQIGEKSLDGRAMSVVKMKPGSFIIATFVDPLIFTIEKATMRVWNLIGRTVPKEKSGDSWKDLDAETRYFWN